MLQSNFMRYSAVLMVGLIIGYLIFGGTGGVNSDHSGHEHAQGESTGELWTCSMHPQIQQNDPGQCPLCGMDLIPMNTGGGSEGVDGDSRYTMTMTPEAVKMAEIRTTEVIFGKGEKLIRVPGKVVVPETGLSVVSAQVSGRVIRQVADFVGKSVSAGDVLLTIWSPELISAQRELIDAVRAEGRVKSEMGRVKREEGRVKREEGRVEREEGRVEREEGRVESEGGRVESEGGRGESEGEEKHKHQEMRSLLTDIVKAEPSERGIGGSTQAQSEQFSAVDREGEAERRGESEWGRGKSEEERVEDVFVEAARNKLRFWRLTDDQIMRIEQRGEVLNEIEILAPRDGIVLRRGVRPDDVISPGMMLYEIADLSKVWLEFEVYERNFGLVREGQGVRYGALSRSGERMTGEIDWIDPVLDNNKRTTRIRVLANNDDGKWSPGMLLDGEIMLNIGSSDVLMVPESSVLWTGPRSVVFVQNVIDDGHPTFELREVLIGNRVGDNRVVLEGLVAGERVVTNGAFKIDAEFQLQGKASMMGGRIQ